MRLSMTYAPHPGFTGSLYHDEPEDASTDSQGMGISYLSLDEALADVRSRLTAYWQTGTVQAGTWFPAIPGQRPSYFEEDAQQLPWLVGPDWIER